MCDRAIHGSTLGQNSVSAPFWWRELYFLSGVSFALVRIDPADDTKTGTWKLNSPDEIQYCLARWFGCIQERMAGMTVLWQSGKSVAHRAAHPAKGAHLLRWLISLGGVGLFGVAIIDSSVIPLPLPGSTDFLLLLLSSHRGSTVVTAVTLAGAAFAGSMVGGYLTWGVGRKGGKAALERYVPRQILGRVTGWVERHGAWSIGLAAVLPPPVPLTPFLLAAGALGVPLTPYLSFYGVARAVRYGLLAWLGVTYGRRIVRLWQKDLSNWSSTVLWIYASLLAVGIAFGIWKFLKARSERNVAAAPAEETA